jgi:hypothetical protein
VPEYLLVLFVLALLAAGPILATVALVWLGRMRRRVDDLWLELRRQQRAAPAPAPPGPATVAGAVPAPTPTATPVGQPTGPPPLPQPAPRPEPAARSEPPPLPPQKPEPRQPAEPAARRPGRTTADLETMIGSRWLVRAGAGALFVGMAFLLKYSFDQGWLGPVPRVLGGMAFGLLLWALGLWWKSRYPVLGQSVFATGSALLYLSVWAARSLYGLLGHLPAFAAMLLVTGATLQVAHAMRALVPAVLGLSGGYLTPVVLGGETETPHALFGYGALLSAAAWTLRWRHGWLLLGPLAVAGATALGAAFVLERDAAGNATALALEATGLLAVLLAFGPVAGSWLRRRLHAADLAAASAAAVLAWFLLAAMEPHAGRTLCALCALGAALLHGTAAWLHRTRVPEDAQGQEGLWLPAAALAALTLALGLDERGLALALCALALLLVRGGSVLGSNTVRWVGNAAGLWAGLDTLLAQPWDLLMDHAPVPAAAAIPFATGAFWVDLAACATLALLGWLQPLWRAGLCAVGGALLVPVVSGELQQWLLPRRWPHPDLAFDRALAWALPLAALAALAARGRALPLQTVALLAGVVPVLLLLQMLEVGCEVGTGTGRSTQLLAMVLVALPLVAAGAAAPLRQVAALALAPAHLVAVVETLRTLPAGSGLGRAALWLAGMAAAALAWGPWLRSQATLPSAGLRSSLPPLLVPLCAFALHDEVTARALPPGIAEAAAVAWAGTAIALLARHWRGPDSAGRVGCDLAGALALAACAAGTAFVQGTPGPLLGNGPFLALAAGPLCLLLADGRDARGPGGRIAALRAGAAWFALFLLCSGEAWRWTVHAAAEHGWGVLAPQVALSLTWTLWAAGTLASGILLRAGPARIAALALFGLTLVKVVLVDLAELPTPLRVLSFLGLGVALMAGGWLYHRFAGRIGAVPPAPD